MARAELTPADVSRLATLTLFLSLSEHCRQSTSGRHVGRAQKQLASIQRGCHLRQQRCAELPRCAPLAAHACRLRRCPIACLHSQPVACRRSAWR